MASAQVQLDSRQLAHVLDVWPVACLATVNAKGQPHLVPIVFVAIDGVIYSPVDGKPKRTGDVQRLFNVAHGGAVSVLLDHYDEDWQALWWLRIDAAADVLEGQDLPAQELERISVALRSKYPQYEFVAMFHAAPVLLRMRPSRHVAWSARTTSWNQLTVPSSPRGPD